MPTVSRFRRHPPPPARAALWLVGLALLALIAVQTLSLLHGIAHAGRSGPAPAGIQAALGARSALSDLPSAIAAAQSLPASDAGSWLDALFGGHGGPECKAFDQASHADLAALATAEPVFAAPTSEPTSVHIAWHLAAQARGFLARGPPSAA
jgi:hypothetical protein